MNGVQLSVSSPRPRLRAKWSIPILIAFFLLGGSAATFAWLFPEHRHIAGAAIESLDPAHRALLEPALGGGRRRPRGPARGQAL